MITREEILAMAKEAGVKFDPHWGIAYNCGTETFIRFFALAYAAGQRDMQEKVAKMFDGEVFAYDYRELAAAIRNLEVK